MQMGKVPIGKDAKGEDVKWEDTRGGKTLPKVEGDTEATGGIYSSQTTRGQNWGPSKRRNEYAYNEWISRHEWGYSDDGIWWGARNPTPGEVAEVGGVTQKLIFGDFE